MMKVLLVRPHNLGRESVMKKRLGGAYPPLGLLYLAAVLEGEGARVALCDELAGDSAEESLDSYKPDLTGVTLCTPLVPRTREIMGACLKRGVRTVIGGPHVSSDPLRGLEETRADMVVFGEGESPLVEIARGAPPEGIRGLAWRSGEKAVLNEPSPPPEDLDALPFPARHLLKWEEYGGSVEFGFIVPRGQRWTHIIGSRGCPFSCTFCASHVVFGRRVRERSIGNILDEMEQTHRTYRVENFTFSDDNFILREDRTREFCDEILRRGLRIRWSCLARVGHSLDTLKLMRKAGCVLVGMGVESGSQEMLTRLKKGTNLEVIREAFAKCREAGISTKAFFMVGLPGETVKDFEASVRFAREIRPDYFWLSVFLPFPGTEIYERNPQSFCADSSYLRSGDAVIDKRYRDFLWRFYSDPAYLVRVLAEGNVAKLSYFFKMFLAYADMRKVR
jgi:radical SAM superfamily enzyme YgiQ (UPF0313 family)